MKQTITRYELELLHNVTAVGHAIQRGYDEVLAAAGVLLLIDPSEGEAYSIIDSFCQCGDQTCDELLEQLGITIADPLVEGEA